MWNCSLTWAKVMTPSEQLYTTGKAQIGKDLAPGNELLGCAISMSAVHNRAFPELEPLRLVNTTQWYDLMKESDLWEEVPHPDPTCVIVAPTGQVPKGHKLSHGHIGLIGQYPSRDGSLYVMSNNSYRGVWDTHFTVKSFTDYYDGIPVYYFKRVSKIQRVLDGVKPLPPDERDLTLGAVIDLPKLETLPSNFTFTPLEIKNQLATDYCTATSTCSISELEEEVTLEPTWLFADSKGLSGDPEQPNQDLRYAMQAHQKHGCVEEKDSPYHFTSLPLAPRDIALWPQGLYLKALVHKKKSYMAITGPYDHFDNIRSSIWYFRNEKRGVVTGTLWPWPLSQITMDKVPLKGNGHSIAIIGWVNDHLIIQNSYGLEAGNKGVHYFSRDIINAMVAQYGAFMFTDYTPDEIRAIMQSGVKIQQSYFLDDLIAAVTRWFTNLASWPALSSLWLWLENR